MQIPDLTPVENFVREVMPTIPGGLQRVTNRTGHLALIGMAATDRGLATRTIGKTTYFFDGRWPVGGMTGWVPTLVGREALKISASKDMTKRMLEAAGVPTPVGITVGPDEFDHALAHVQTAERAMVLKPSHGYAGHGITCGIASEPDLRAAWETAEAAGSTPTPTFVLEEQVEGIDIRAFVVGRRVVAAVTRVNAHVVGDGVRTLAELVEEKQRLRADHNPRYAKHPIVVDAELLRRCGRALRDVPASGEIIVVNSIANNHVGGESVDVTDLAHPGLFRLAVDAARAIPGLGLAGIDLMSPDLDSADRAVVLEVNVEANIRVHLFPAYGKPREVAGAIVDEMIATAASEQQRHARRASPRTADRRANGSVDNPVERFVREVLPTIRGGFQRTTDATGHLALIRRAAKNRGLTIRKVGGTTYFYDGRLPVGGMTKWVPTLVNRQALAVCVSKDLTKQMLTAAGLPTPAGIAVGPDQLDEALAYVRAADRLLVLKPVSAKGGDGITCDIATEEDLRAAWVTAERAAGENARFLLEEQVAGVDIRAFVVGRRVVAATTRLHAHVVGDGRHSITELVELKQPWRAQHALLYKRPVIVDTSLLARAGRTVDDVPAIGEVVVLNNLANVHVGGENVDVTEIAHPDLLELAVDAARAIPGVGVAGIDLLTPDLASSDGAVILEANVQANIRLHHLPAYGKPRDVAGAIIDEMIATAGAPPRRARPKPGLARRVARAVRRRLSAG